MTFISNRFYLFAIVLLSPLFVESSNPNKKVILRTCPCKVHNLKELTDFIEFDVPEFGDRISLDYESKDDPHILQLGPEGEIIQKIDLSSLDRIGIRRAFQIIGVEPFFELAQLNDSSEL